MWLEKRPNFPIHFLLFLSPCWSLPFSSGTIFDSVMWIGFSPADCLFFGFILCFLPFNLSHISIPSIVPKKKKVWIISHSLLLSLVCSCGFMAFKSSTAFSSAWKKGAELRQCLHSLFMHIDELRGNVSTKTLSPTEESLIGILNLYIILRKKDLFLPSSFPFWEHWWTCIQFKCPPQHLTVFSVWVVLIKGW